MPAANPNNSIPSVGFNSVPPINHLGDRIRHYFDQHPEVSREKFLMEAVRREIDYREQRERARPRRGKNEATRSTAARSQPNAEDLRVRASVAQRLAVFHYERCGLWPKVRRFFFK